MFALVGTEEFKFGPKSKHVARVHIDAGTHYSFIYRLEIDGKSTQSFSDHIKRALRVWKFTARAGTTHQVVVGM